MSGVGDLFLGQSGSPSGATGGQCRFQTTAWRSRREDGTFAVGGDQAMENNRCVIIGRRTSVAVLCMLCAFFGGAVEGVALGGIDDRGALFEQAVDLLVAVILVIDSIACQIKQPERVVGVRLDRIIDPECKIGFL